MLGSWRNRIVPLWMECITGYGEDAHLAVFDLDAFRVVGRVELLGGGGRNQLDDGHSTGERTATPVL